jgi:hypothetical protein
MMLVTIAAVVGAGMALGSSPDGTSFDWLAGHWCGGTEERRIEEVWLPEAGGALLGMSRTWQGGTTESFEFMRLVPDGKAAGFHVQPNGASPTTFVIAGRGEDWVVFENAAHDFPNRIEYRRVGQTLQASISGPGEGGNAIRVPFDYHRCDQ